MDLLTRYALLILLIAVTLTFALVIDGFWTVDNIRAIAVNQITVLCVALAVTIALTIGVIDLSAANVVGLSQAVTVGMMAFSGLGILPSILIGLAVSALVGLVNAILVVKVGLDSLIATLAMSSILTGLVIWYTKGTSIFQGLEPGYRELGNGSIFGVPFPIIYGVVIVLVCVLVFEFLPTGRRLYAIGGNKRAAVLTGIRVRRLTVLTFVTVSVLAGIGGVVISARLGAATPDLGPSFLLPAFAAAYLGSATVQPGRFNPLGTTIAVYLLAVIGSGAQQLGAPSWSTYVINGIALIVGVTISVRLVKMRKSQARQRQIRNIKQHAEESAAVQSA